LSLFSLDAYMVGPAAMERVNPQMAFGGDNMQSGDSAEVLAHNLAYIEDHQMIGNL
jgi:hypothetical protein